MSGERTGTFITTKGHRRFIEFANAVRKHRYVKARFSPDGMSTVYASNESGAREIYVRPTGIPQR